MYFILFYFFDKARTGALEVETQITGGTEGFWCVCVCVWLVCTCIRGVACVGVWVGTVMAAPTWGHRRHLDIPSQPPTSHT